MEYQQVSRGNYFAQIMGLNAIIVIFATLAVLGLVNKNITVFSIAGIGIVAFFLAMHRSLKIAILEDAARDAALVNNIRRKYFFTDVKVLETSIAKRSEYGTAVLVFDGGEHQELFVRTSEKNNEPFLFSVRDGEKTLFESSHQKVESVSA